MAYRPRHCRHPPGGGKNRLALCDARRKTGPCSLKNLRYSYTTPERDPAVGSDLTTKSPAWTPGAPPQGRQGRRKCQPLAASWRVVLPPPKALRGKCLDCVGNFVAALAPFGLLGLPLRHLIPAAEFDGRSRPESEAERRRGRSRERTIAAAVRGKVPICGRPSDDRSPKRCSLRSKAFGWEGQSTAAGVAWRLRRFAFAISIVIAVHHASILTSRAGVIPGALQPEPDWVPRVGSAVINGIG